MTDGPVIGSVCVTMLPGDGWAAMLMEVAHATKNENNVLLNE